MPKFAANLSMLYGEVDFIDRFECASRAGFRGVEFWFPYALEKNSVADRLKKWELVQVLHNLPAGDWERGERGIACLPDRIGEFQDGVGKGIEYASALGCNQLNCLAGNIPGGVPLDKLRTTFIENVRFAAKHLAEANIKLLLESINTRDVPRFFLTHTQQAVDIIEDANVENVFLQYDIYHMQIMEGDLTATIEHNLSRIAHLQIADSPGRHEPGTGEINYDFIFSFVDRVGYQGWLGCEYNPVTTTEAGLSWLTPYADILLPPRDRRAETR